MDKEAFKKELIRYIEENTTNAITDIENISEWQWDEMHEEKMNFSQCVDYLLEEPL